MAATPGRGRDHAFYKPPLLPDVHHIFVAAFPLKFVYLTTRQPAKLQEGRLHPAVKQC